MAVVRINYKAAKMLLERTDLQLRPKEDYEGKTWRPYDIELMFQSLEAKVDDVPYQRFFDKIRREKAEWLAQDLVVDRREGWKSWAWRNMNFDPPPMVPREQLPVEL